MDNLPYYEDVNYIYLKKIFETLFPKNIKNKHIVYIVSLLHLIGGLLIGFGIFIFPNDLLLLYIIYLLIILLSYQIFDGYCFMTLLSNKYSGRSDSPLCIRKSTAIILVIINIFFAIIGIYFPKKSLHYIFFYKI